MPSSMGLTIYLWEKKQLQEVALKKIYSVQHIEEGEFFCL